MFLCIDEVLTLTCDERCEMKMESLDTVSADEMSQIICAFLNSSQTSRHCLFSGITHLFSLSIAVPKCVCLFSIIILFKVVITFVSFALPHLL